MPCSHRFAADQTTRLNTHPHYRFRVEAGQVAVLAETLADRCYGDAHCKLVVDHLRDRLLADAQFPAVGDVVTAIAEVAAPRQQPYGVIGCEACKSGGNYPGWILYWRWDAKFQRDYEYARRCECNPDTSAEAA